MRGRPVSRILFRGRPPSMTIPLGTLLPVHSSCQPGPLGLKRPCERYVCTHSPRARSLFGVAPGGACRAASVASRAVGSYSTVSPLPRYTGRSVLCGAIPGVAPAGRYPAPLLDGVRTFLAPKSKRYRPAAIQPSAPRCFRSAQSVGQRESVGQDRPSWPPRAVSAARSPAGKSAGERPQGFDPG
ncbi:hypothetical protein AQS8620_02604 [Aquimixticola soesokkakensis]|uniref:Uncharacterized protein n=1 Tax=Aquimixticola soesokkakensis TaxID=1519096 RepID=A0A1Y5TCL3_9RHOB|nr:hypothetical protein AQS8620_02604 [Aquimixticola soesokkakensis]